jgi:hypothetical protein
MPGAGLGKADGMPRPKAKRVRLAEALNAEFTTPSPHLHQFLRRMHQARYHQLVELQVKQCIMKLQLFIDFQCHCMKLFHNILNEMISCNVLPRLWRKTNIWSVLSTRPVAEHVVGLLGWKHN